MVERCCRCVKTLEPNPATPYFQYGGARKKLCHQCMTELKIKPENLDRMISGEATKSTIK